MNYRSLITCLAITLSVTSLCGTRTCTKLQEINTAGNSVGIEEGDVCRYNAKDKTVECESGKSFKNVGAAESALTGTPGHLSYRNYIGMIKSKESKKGMVGSGKRLDICADGTCLRTT